MSALLNITELSVVARETIDLDDPYAQWVIDAASLIVCETAGHPEWAKTSAPARAIMIAQQLAKRAFLNPDAERSFNTGPIGAVTVEDFARTLELTPFEREYLEGVKTEGLPDLTQGVLFTISATNRPGALLRPVVLNDDSGSAIIYGNEGEFDTAFGDPLAP